MKYFKILITLIFILLFLKSCTGHISKYINPYCQDKIITVTENMIMFDGRFYHHNMLNAICYNELMSYEEYNQTLDSFNNYPDELKELKLYKNGSKFKVIGHYYLVKNFMEQGFSSNSHDYLLQSLEDGSFTWFPRYEFNEYECKYEKDYYNFHGKNIDKDKFLIPVVFFEPVVNKFKEKGLDLRIVTKVNPKKRERYRKDLNRTLPKR